MTYQHSDDCPHTPAADPLWQESDCFWFADLACGVTGFLRIGQHPAQDEGAVLLFLATETGAQFRSVFRSAERARDDSSQTVRGHRAESLGDMAMRYTWQDEGCAGDLTFCESFYVPRGWAKDESASGLNDTINDQGHLECTGRLTGTVSLNGVSFTLNALAHRDRSWGVRNIGMVAQHRMITGSVGPALSFASTALQLSTGHLHKAGFVVRDGVEEDLADVEIIAHVAADGISVMGGSARLTTQSGEVIDLTCETIGSFGHVYADTYLTTENMSRVHWNGETGFCDLETSINAQQGTHVPEQAAVLSAMMENGYREI